MLMFGGPKDRQEVSLESGGPLLVVTFDSFTAGVGSFGYAYTQLTPKEVDQRLRSLLRSMREEAQDLGWAGVCEVVTPVDGMDDPPAGWYSGELSLHQGASWSQSKLWAKSPGQVVGQLFHLYKTWQLQ